MKLTSCQTVKDKTDEIVQKENEKLGQFIGQPVSELKKDNKRFFMYSNLGTKKTKNRVDEQTANNENEKRIKFIPETKIIASQAEIISNKILIAKPVSLSKSGKKEPRTEPRTVKKKTIGINHKEITEKKIYLEIIKNLNQPQLNFYLDQLITKHKNL